MQQYHRGCKGPIDSSQKGMFPFMPCMISSQLQVSKVKSIKRSPVYLFYEIVANGSDGTLGDDGDVHYCCLHGTHKVCTIKRSMRSNLNGAFCICYISNFRLTIILVLVNNLRVHIKPMYRLYCILKDREDPPTPNDIAIASGKKMLDANTEAEYLKKFNNASGNIKKAFEDQLARGRVREIIPFNYLHLMNLLTGTLGPGEVRTTSYEVGHCMRSAI